MEMCESESEGGIDIQEKLLYKSSDIVEDGEQTKCVKYSK